MTEPNSEMIERFKASKGTPMLYTEVNFRPTENRNNTITILAIRDDGMRFFVECKIPEEHLSLNDKERAVLCTMLQVAMVQMDTEMRMAPRASVAQDKANEFKQGLTK